MDISTRLSRLGISLPEILLPAEKTDMQKWAVIACDQYSSEPAYWRKAAEFIGDSPSTLNLIYPECYLEEENGEKRIGRIRASMNDYLKNTLSSIGESFVLVKRTTPDSPERWGIVAALDLEAYDYSSDSKSLIRATEGTILDRIPPRKKIRLNAPLELPHIMVLINDQERSCFEPLQKKTEKLRKLYDFKLMFDSGHITGYHICDSGDIENIVKSLESIKDRDNAQNPMLYAMGDGNHSLATAKSIWEDIKKKLSDAEQEKHPARFALVELVNLYDTGIIFEPIHRVLFNTDPAAALKSFLSESGGTFSTCSTIQEVSSAVSADPKTPTIGIISENIKGTVSLTPGPGLLPTGVVQDWLDIFLSPDSESSLDYIHGTDSTESLALEKNNMGILLPAIDKESFFDAIKRRGVLPRKTFSMGEAREKRFYIESRKIL